MGVTNKLWDHQDQSSTNQETGGRWFYNNVKCILLNPSLISESYKALIRQHIFWFRNTLYPAVIRYSNGILHRLLRPKLPWNCLMCILQTSSYECNHQYCTTGSQACIYWTSSRDSFSHKITQIKWLSIVFVISFHMMSTQTRVSAEYTIHGKRDKAGLKMHYSNVSDTCISIAAQNYTSENLYFVIRENKF